MPETDTQTAAVHRRQTHRQLLCDSRSDPQDTSQTRVSLWLVVWIHAAQAQDHTRTWSVLSLSS